MLYISIFVFFNLLSRRYYASPNSIFLPRTCYKSRNNASNFVIALLYIVLLSLLLIVWTGAEKVSCSAWDDILLDKLKKFQKISKKKRKLYDIHIIIYPVVSLFFSKTFLQVGFEKMSPSIFSSLREAFARSKQANLGRFGDMLKHNWYLGFTAFGGPAVHFQIVCTLLRMPVKSRKLWQPQGGDCGLVPSSLRWEAQMVGWTDGKAGWTELKIVKGVVMWEGESSIKSSLLFAKLCQALGARKCCIASMWSTVDSSSVWSHFSFGGPYLPRHDRRMRLADGGSVFPVPLLHMDLLWELPKSTRNSLPKFMLCWQDSMRLPSVLLPSLPSVYLKRLSRTGWPGFWFSWVLPRACCIKPCGTFRSLCLLVVWRRSSGIRAGDKGFCEDRSQILKMAVVLKAPLVPRNWGSPPLPSQSYVEIRQDHRSPDAHLWVMMQTSQLNLKRERCQHPWRCEYSHGVLVSWSL